MLVLRQKNIFLSTTSIFSSSGLQLIEITVEVESVFLSLVIRVDSESQRYGRQNLAWCGNNL